MVSGDDRVKIADFGIAKVTDEAHVTTALTVKGTTIGTPTYMAPEQAMGGEIGPWTDLYAVGVIAFELLAGRPPFDTSGAPMAILLRHVNEPPLELATVDPSADPRLSDWIARLLVKDPEDRVAERRRGMARARGDRARPARTALAEHDDAAGDGRRPNARDAAGAERRRDRR